MANKLAITLGLTTLWVITGIIGTMWVQGLHFITACYVVVQIITTIGYGDISVNSNMHWFMTFYVIFGLCVAASAINDVFSKVLEKSQETLRKRMKEMEKNIKKGEKEANTIQASHHELNDMLAALAIITVFVLGGAIFYMLYESCTCSYGVSKVTGCLEGTCDATGGIQKDFAKSIYMSVITLTTVGFGDFTPKSQGGRVFGIFWMIAGVLAFGNFVTALGAWIDATFKKDHSTAFGREIFDSIDKDQNGHLNRSEFMAWMLVKEGIVAADQIDHFSDLFEALATKNAPTASGKPMLTFSTLRAYFHEDDGCSDSESGELLTEIQ